MHHSQLRISTAASSPASALLRRIDSHTVTLSAVLPADVLSAPTRLTVIFYLGVGSWALLALFVAIAV